MDREFKNIGKKLLAIQQKLEAPKDQHNEFGGYRYRSCEGILTALKPLLDEFGCIVTITDKMIQIGDRCYVEACATIADIESGESISTTACAREQQNRKGMDEAQLTGATSSYARKYALNGLFAIDDIADADSINTHDDDECTPVQGKPAVNDDSGHGGKKGSGEVAGDSGAEISSPQPSGNSDLDRIRYTWKELKDSGRDADELLDKVTQFPGKDKKTGELTGETVSWIKSLKVLEKKIADNKYKGNLEYLANKYENIACEYLGGGIDPSEIPF